MPRPRGRIDYTRRIRAYELFAAGLRKADIARELGVSKVTIGNWGKADRWDDRQASMVAKAEVAVDHVVGNAVAEALASLRGRLRKRIEELETLCSAGIHPGTRMAAIKLWFELAKKMETPDPLAPPTNPGQLELINDLLEDSGAIPRETDLIGGNV